MEVGARNVSGAVSRGCLALLRSPHHKPIITATGSANSPIWGIKQNEATGGPTGVTTVAPPVGSEGDVIEMEMPSLLEIGRRAAMQAEREAIERVLAQTRWNRRQAAKILKISYKALLNKLKAMEEQNRAHSRQRSA